MQDILQTFRDYYRTPAVRNRILEFLGGSTPADATCEFITADGIGQPVRAPRSPGELFARLDEGLDICRSLWDRESLIAHLDVEYVNFDFAAEAYLDPARTFLMQEPVARAIRRILDHHGIDPLHVLSGRGHHFAWRIDRGSEAFKSLAAMGKRASIDDSFPSKDSKDYPLLSQAFAGLGMVMEFLGRLVIELARPESEIPIELTAVEVGPSGRGREMISIDLSEYGDPLHTRTVRVPFSAYLKPWQQLYAVGSNNISKIGPIIFVPVDGLDIRQGMVVMRDPALAARLAERISARIPNQTFGTSSLIRHYQGSALRRYHEYFYSSMHDPVDRWPWTYDRAPLGDLPVEARNALMFPNDLLLKPSGIRSVTECLLERDWHPRHIAGLIRSKFERDYDWGSQWIDYSPAMRADFYVRIFSSAKTSVAREAARIRGREISGDILPELRATPATENQLEFRL
ncbi:MAG: hypothetical protein ACO3FQ_04030 [Terrimicrobiaceae bacterium]